MARLKNPRDYASNIAAVDNKAMGQLYKRAATDPLILTRNAQLGAMDEEAQVMSVVGMILYPEEFDTVLYAAPSTQDKMCKRGISQRYPAPWTNQPPASARWLKAEEYFAASFRQVREWPLVFGRIVYISVLPAKPIQRRCGVANH